MLLSEVLWCRDRINRRLRFRRRMNRMLVEIEAFRPVAPQQFYYPTIEPPY